MSIHTKVTATGVYFITFTCHHWRQLIELVKGYDLVYKWFDILSVNGQCRIEKFLLQKLNYIHNNPCTGKWKLTDSPIHYPHSSALFYMNGKTWNYPVKDYQELLSFDNYED